MKNALKLKLERGDAVFGTWMMTNSFDAAEILAHVGCDCIMIDAEHGSMDIESAGRLVTAIKTTDTTPLLRVPWNDIALIKRGLDTGTHGIMIPMVNTAEEARQVVQFCKYPPAGVRGMGAGRAAMFGTMIQDYVPDANIEVLTILQIEHHAAVKNAEEILSVPGIDIAFVGPGDLSTSMGLPMTDPAVGEACKKVADACKRHHVTAGIYSWPEGMRQHLDMGFRLLIGGMDGASIYNGAKKIWDEFKVLTGR